ncbi:hypothetical protein FQA39_LY02697 [Lamprigera yunnana]|nr:hypothetical protein FQA39_LY02697 [Lamprigera yunnana]
MKFFLVFAMIALALVAFAQAVPLESDSEGQIMERADRHKRLTCDLLSFETSKFAVNHSACATHCLALRNGYKGGTCKNGVCHCRK